MQVDQPPGLAPTLDPTLRQPQLAQLRVPDDAVLTGRERRDLSIDLEKTTHTVVRSRPT
ncbi:MAG: hypothetical protein ABUM26_00965 [Solirubrobacterales bacterium]